MGDVYHALDDSTRRAILDELFSRDGQTLLEICAVLSGRHGITTTRQGISQHLGILEAAGLLRTERRGRSKYHHFDPTPLREIASRWPTGRSQHS